MDRWYYAKKWFAIFPGVLRPAAAPFLHDHYRAVQASRGPARLMLDAAVCAGFNLWVPFRAHSVARRFGLGSEWARQARGIARRRFVDPNDIAVFRIASDADADRFMRRFEYAAISKRINPAAWTDDCVLADKARFAARCAQHGLPSPPLLARAIDGRVTVEQAPPGATVAIKPTGGLGGEGFHLLALDDADRARSGFAARLARHFATRRGDWIVQPAVPGHPALRDIALAALSTARITTMLDERGEPEIVTAVLRFAGDPAAVVDNLAAGGLLAPIDVATGRLGPASYGRRPEDAVVHPVTGAQIEGRILPFWVEARALVTAAHRTAFAEYSMVGWDVGIAADGPLLIEGNGKPGLFAAQRAGRTGVGETRFGALIAHHLAATRAG